MRLRSRAASATALLFSLTACHPSPRPGNPAAAAARASGTTPVSGPLAQLQRDLDDILAAPLLQHGYWGVTARSLQTGDSLYALNAHRLLMPASTMKIVTMAAAGERLGWDYTYETRLVGLGTIDGGLLNGDLLVVGSGDPSIGEQNGAGTRLFAAWADRIKAAGIRTISGRIVGDDRAFDDQPLGFGWSWDDLAEGFAAPTGALQYNENTVDVTIHAGAQAGLPAEVALAPAGSGLAVDNRIRTSAPGVPPSIEVRRLAGNPRLELRGSMPLGATPGVRAISVDNPTLFFVTALRNALVENGIEVRGPAVDIDDVTDVSSATSGVVLVSYRSPPLSSLGTTLMKESQNLYAETFLKTIGRPGDGSGRATIEGGRAATNATLQQWGVPISELVQRDGSGLSRYDYVTADALAGVLTHVGRDARLRGPFEAALPIAGRDGTLSGRMKGTPAEGNVRAKTGSMANVRALAGYLTTADGEPVVFSILANNFETAPDEVTRTIDAIVVRLANFSRR